MNDFDTVRMPAAKANVKKKIAKAEVIKAWTPIVTAIIALAGTVVVTILNADDVEQHQIDSVEQQVEKHLNDTFAPKIAEYVNSLKERIIKLETMNEVYKDEIDRLRLRVNQLAAGRRRVEPVLPSSIKPKALTKLKKKDKLDLPKLDIRQQAEEL